jgi:hypothetical protein
MTFLVAVQEYKNSPADINKIVRKEKRCINGFVCKV